MRQRGERQRTEKTIKIIGGSPQILDHIPTLVSYPIPTLVTLLHMNMVKSSNIETLGLMTVIL